MPSIVNATTTAGVAIQGDNSGVLALQTNNGTTAVTIDTSQNVGIGTASPNAPLHVTRSTGGVTSTFANTATNNQNANVNAVSDNATAVSLRVFGSAAGSAGMLAANSTMLYTSAADLNLVADNGSGVIKFATGGTTERMRITSTGNVGINTSGPSAKLTVNDANPTRGIVGRFSNTAGSSQTGAQIQISQSAVQDWAFGQPAGVDAFAFWSGRDISSADGTERMRIASDGTISTTIGSTLYGAYSARAWVNFNGTGTVAIRQSRNVSSITDNNTGDYTVNLTTAMPDGEYSAVSSGGTGGNNIRMCSCSPVSTTSTSQIRVIGITVGASALIDLDVVSVAIFR
jgi:hypothetical protein